ncbi:MAG: hypothetical protein ACI965_002023 [Paraglaciecola sp.]
MANIEFSKDHKDAIVGKIQQYFSQELDQDLAQFDAEFLLDFFSEQIGGLYYNQALQDAQAVLENKLDNITDAIYELEKPSQLR